MTNGLAFVLRELRRARRRRRGRREIRARRRHARTAIATSSPASTTRRCCARRSSCSAQNAAQRARHGGIARRVPGHGRRRAPVVGARRTTARSSASCAAIARASTGSTIRANRDVVEAMLVANIRDMTPALAQAVVRSAARRQGRPRRATRRSTSRASRTVLALRSKYGVAAEDAHRPAITLRRQLTLRTSKRTSRPAGTALTGRLSRSRAWPKTPRQPRAARSSGRDDIDPHHRWDRPLQAPGHTQVDFEERVNFRRLHDYRLARTRAALANSGLGALLCFDQHNIRYTTSTVIGEWARDKLTRYSLLTGNGDPYIWDFGSAAKHHRLHAPWLHHDHCRAGPARPARRGRRRQHAVPRRGAARSRRSSTRKASATCRSASTSSSRRCCSSCRSWASRCATASR